MLSEEKSLDQLIDDAMRRLGACFSKDEMRSVLEVLVTNTLKSKQVEAVVRAELAGQEPFDANDPRFREAFEASLKSGNWPMTRLGEGYRSSITMMAFTVAYETVNRLRLYAAPVVQPDDSKDAERYRWLRSNSYVGVSARKECLWIPKGVFEIPGKGFDAAIDAAIDAAEKEQA